MAAFFMPRGSRSSNRFSSSQSFTTTTISPTEPSVPLLTGDEFYVSRDGIARTLYQLDGEAVATATSSHLLAIEELYDLGDATKKFVVRQDGRWHPLSNGSASIQQPYQEKKEPDVILGPQAQGLVHMGSLLKTFQLQEIDSENLFGAAGTGATTWEASIAMSLYFASHPEQLQGHVIEIGCGIGLGGMLNAFLCRQGALASMVLTDGNDQVLRQCRENMRNSGNKGLPWKGNVTPIQVTKLDWNDFVEAGATSPHYRQYDTVIACDCAYLHTDIEVLCKTVLGLLREDNARTSPPATIQLFGPCNRSALHEVIRWLNNDNLGMDVVLETIDMSRFRLKPARRDLDLVCSKRSWQEVAVNDCAFASNAKATFLHVRVSKKKPKTTTPLSDID